jgi:hypothetical protein
LAYLGNSYLCILASFAVFYKYYKAFYSCNTVAFSTDFSNRNVVFFSGLYWFWTVIKTSTAAAAAKSSTAATAAVSAV